MSKTVRSKKCQGGHSAGRESNALLRVLVRCDGDENTPLPRLCWAAKSIERQAQCSRIHNTTTAACTTIPGNIHPVLLGGQHGSVPGWKRGIRT